MTDVMCYDAPKPDLHQRRRALREEGWRQVCTMLRRSLRTYNYFDRDWKKDYNAALKRYGDLCID